MYFVIAGIAIAYLSHFLFLKRLKAFARKPQPDLQSVFKFVEAHSAGELWKELTLGAIGLGLIVFGLYSWVVSA